jgi:hypothetical protein
MMRAKAEMIRILIPPVSELLFDERGGCAGKVSGKGRFVLLIASSAANMLRDLRADCVCVREVAEDAASALALVVQQTCEANRDGGVDVYELWLPIRWRRA